MFFEPVLDFLAVMGRDIITNDMNDADFLPSLGTDAAGLQVIALFFRFA
jgi:hypothetical protein